MGLASEESGADRWSVDHLFLVPRSGRRPDLVEVVGQMRDSAANAAVYGPIASIRSQFAARCALRSIADRVLGRRGAGRKVHHLVDLATSAPLPSARGFASVAAGATKRSEPRSRGQITCFAATRRSQHRSPNIDTPPCTTILTANGWFVGEIDWLAAPVAEQGMNSSPTLHVYLLGGFRVVVGDVPVPARAWPARPAQIVKLLALDPAHRLHREQVMEVLWPDLDLDAQANNLNVALHAARKALTSAGAPKATFLTRDRDAVVLGPPEALLVDVDAFEQAVASAWRSSEPVAMREALDRYTGDLLPDEPYAEWLEGRRTALRTSFLALLTRLGQAHAERGETSSAIEAFGRLVAAEPTQEEAHVALMRLYALAGQRAQAQAQFEQLTAILERELDVEPDVATRELAEAIRAGRFPEAAQPLVPEVVPAASPPRPTPSNLPALVSDLIGREREIAEVHQLLSTARLVTLTGAGGIGKTRLAVAVAGAAEDACPDGVVFVDLAPIHDPAQVIATIARTLAVRDAGEPPLSEVVGAHLREKQVLLVLDNFEQVVEAAPVVPALLEGAPRLRIIVTSRRRLRLRGEREYVVPALGLPDIGQPVLDAAALQSPAVALFTRRVQEVRPAFRLTMENAPDVVAICTRLDGLPLAIELAAARSKVLTAHDIRTRLDRPLALLTGGPRDLPSRQQTMRATIQWSNDLLAPAEQRLLRRLAVFVGGWSLAAAESVVNAEGDLGSAVLDGLASLVDTSLVTLREQADGERRFGMLETIREYALELLALHDEAGDVARRHAAYFLSLAQAGAPLLVGPDQPTWLARFDAENDNLRVALGWAFRQSDHAAGLRLAAALWRFWELRGRVTEGRSWLQQALAHGNGAPADVRASLLLGLGLLTRLHGDYGAAAAARDESLRLARSLDDSLTAALALYGLGTIAAWQDPPDYQLMETYSEEALTLFRATGYRDGIARCLMGLGIAARYHHDVARARSLFEESLGEERAAGNVNGQALALGLLGHLLLKQGDAIQAAACFREMISLTAAHGLYYPLAAGLGNMGDVAEMQGQWARQVRLQAAAHALRQQAGLTMAASDLAEGDESRALARQHLGEEVFTRAWDAGRSMPLAEAVAYALASAHTSANDAVPTLATGRSPRTDKEQRLLGNGTST
jgi:predicted ATPase/DNA-binding SARP family transcriptional activator